MVDPALSREPPTFGTPLLFGPSDRPLTGFYHAPASDPTRPLGVVLCNPLGFERMSVHRTYRHLAKRLAAKGFAALRFDYDGTGDSPSQPEDPGRFNAWISGIRAASSELRARAGCDRIALFGVRFGATLAALAAADQGEIEELILWAPILSGQAFVRELRAYRLFKYSKSRRPQRKDGSEEIGGYFFSGETLSDMSTVDLLAPKGRAMKRVLILPRNERSTDEVKLLERWEAEGTEVRLLADTSYGAMMRDDPYDSVVPVEALDSIVEWLGEGCPPSEPQKKKRASALGQPPHLELPVGPRPGRIALRETHCLFGEGARLHGVLTEPEGSVPKHRPAICLLNVGANHQIGPHRMNVELARELASMGYVSFRFDVSGLGNSEVAPGTAENRIYTQDTVADVRYAMDLLGQMRDLSRFVLFGLCSGAYLAFHTAVQDQRVVGQVLLSPYAFEWQEGDPVTPTLRQSFRGFRSTRFYARALMDRRAWWLVLRGEVDVGAIAGVVLERIQAQLEHALPQLSALLRRKRRPQSQIERAFWTLSDRGVDSFLVLAYEDGGLDMIAKYLGRDARRMRGRQNFKLEILDDVDHTFTTMASQFQLREILKGYLAARFP